MQIDTSVMKPTSALSFVVPAPSLVTLPVVGEARLCLFIEVDAAAEKARAAALAAQPPAVREKPIQYPRVPD